MNNEEFVEKINDASGLNQLIGDVFVEDRNGEYYHVEAVYVDRDGDLIISASHFPKAGDTVV